ncbi:hypothetical protein D3C79_631510 [compost metagenome]
MGRETTVGLNVAAAVRRQFHLTHIAGHHHQPQFAAFQILRRRQHARSDIAAIHQPVLQGAHQQVDALPAQALALRLIGNALQRQPMREFVLAGQNDLFDWEAGFFLRERNAAKTGRRRRQPHIRRRGRQLLFQRFLPLLLYDQLIAIWHCRQNRLIEYKQRQDNGSHWNTSLAHSKAERRVSREAHDVFPVEGQIKDKNCK